MSKGKVLVTGGTGFIGSHVNRMLHQSDYETVVLDNLSRSLPQDDQDGLFVEGDLGNRDLLNRLFEQHDFAGVMHFAGLIDVGESFSKPSDYYIQNVAYTSILLDVMARHNVHALVFSSSAAIFGDPTQDAVDETHQKHPISPYGRSKWIIEQMLPDYEDAYGLRSACLRYFNAAGGDPEGVVKNRKKLEHNLIPKLLRSLLADGAQVHLNGTDYPTPDGTCVRDYIHVNDLARAHILALEHLLDGGESCRYNLGNGAGYSIRDVIGAVEKVTGHDLPIVEGPRRRGDPAKLVANAEQARVHLGWTVNYPALDTIVEHAWRALQ